MTFKQLFTLLASGIWLAGCSSITQPEDYTRYVKRFTGTGATGMITPIAGVPQGMVQLGPDTRTSGTGYHYDDTTLLRFSHVHRSGGGCSEFEDIAFLPLDEKSVPRTAATFPKTPITLPLDHACEEASPGYYSIRLAQIGTKAELTATARCGMQRYNRSEGWTGPLLIDLQHGSCHACTIWPEDDYDTVQHAAFEILDPYTIRGYRVSNGFIPQQQVYFYTKLSKPIQQANLYKGYHLQRGALHIKGRNLQCVLYFDPADTSALIVKTGISPVDVEGAQLNLEREIPEWNFDEIVQNSHDAWQQELSKIEIETEDTLQKQMFYTSLFFTQTYPMLLSDVDGRFRGPDQQIYHSERPYYAGAVSIWDTFRGACPLQTILCPQVMNDYVETFIRFADISGLLPICVWWGGETYQMLGQHTIPIITDCYVKGLRDYDPEEAYAAMRSAAMRDTTGFSMRYFVGLKNYKKYGYVPADLEMESVARTLEYAYNDWCLARMAKELGKEEDYHYFLKRAHSYRNLFDSTTQLMRGRLSDGSWRTPFDPYASNHRRDDYCEGNAWQWTFFVPHDVAGLADLLGGKEQLIARLDTLFTLQSSLSGENSSGDITGLIGQYAHGNEPSHHTAFMYSYLGQPWKTQQRLHEILTTQYHPTPEGICGNEDCGQMSAWYVLCSMGWYPVRHGDGTYIIASPLFPVVRLHLPNGKILTVKTERKEASDIYIQSVKRNGRHYEPVYFTYEELMQGGEILFEMGSRPNPKWGTSPEALPPSMSDSEG